MTQSFLHRIGGLLCLLIAAATTWFGIYQPLQSAQAGSDVVKWMPKLTVLIALTTIFGLFFLLTGNRYPYRDVQRQTLTRTGWILFTLIAILALGGYFYMDHTLRQMGYRY